jgi:Transposase, Mutator family
LLPDAPVPDGRTVLTNPDVQDIEAVTGHRRHPSRFIRDTNTIEALNRQIRKAIKTKGHFPNEDAAIAVGTALAGGPPHRSQRALLTHWAPALGDGVKTDGGPGVQDPGWG